MATYIRNKVTAETTLKLFQLLFILRALYPDQSWYLLL